MPTQREKADIFRGLHQQGDPLVLYNIWDPGSAKVVEKAGAKALATGSAPVAMSQNYPDGEKIPLDVALSNVSRIVQLTALPVTLDFEGAYSADPDQMKAHTRKALDTGVVGFNIEDQVVGTDTLYDSSVQAARIAAVKAAIEDSGVNAFINARTDLFLKSDRADHDAAMLEHAIARAEAYVNAGADGFFAPNLVDEGLIKTLCTAVSVPVNIIALPGCPAKDALATLGVSRISYGPMPYKTVMASLAEAASNAFNE
ncbi:MAG TPA: isocitrate lyase/phosphoenolpyruvate mutase family protein [Gammaproteobacteria bacterium]|nr:isocitrate lyase/phosphoenolpyruvate mutase family protein [Gammaproteobacteria bacterium]